MGVLEMKRNLRLGGGAQEIEQVARIKAYFHRCLQILGWQALLALSGFRKRRVNVQLAFRHSQANCTRPLIGKLRYTLHRLSQFLSIQNHGVRMILRPSSLEIREVARELPAQKHALSQLEEKVILIAGKLQHRVRGRVLSKFHDLAHSL